MTLGQTYCAESDVQVENSEILNPFIDFATHGQHPLQIFYHLAKGANAPRTRAREAVTWGRKLYWTHEPPAEEHEPVEGSFVEFYVNGESLGRFRNVKTGTYFPTLSLYTGEQRDPARARCEFSQPRFAHRYPPACVPWSEGLR